MSVCRHNLRVGFNTSISTLIRRLWYRRCLPVNGRHFGPQPVWLLQSLLLGLPVNLIQHLQSVQNAAARLSFGLRRSEHITNALASLHWLGVPERILYNVAVLIYQTVNDSTQKYLSSYFTRVAGMPSRLRHRSSKCDQLVVPSYNLASVSRRDFPVAAAFLWNSHLYISHQHRHSRFSGSVLRRFSSGAPILTFLTL